MASAWLSGRRQVIKGAAGVAIGLCIGFFLEVFLWSFQNPDAPYFVPENPLKYPGNLDSNKVCINKSLLNLTTSDQFVDLEDVMLEDFYKANPPKNKGRYRASVLKSFDRALEIAESITNLKPVVQQKFPQTKGVLEICVLTYHYGCPGWCHNVWKLLPPFQKFTVSTCDKERLKEGPTSDNMLIIVRNDIGEIADIVANWRRSTDKAIKNAFVGVYLMADELNDFGSSDMFGIFDYAFRNYYFPELKNAPNVHLRALGNQTCGTNPRIDPFTSWESVLKNDRWKGRDPPLGSYWFPPLEMESIPDLPITQLVPASKREYHCCFIGSMRADRQEMVDKFQEAMKRYGDKMKCKIVVEGNFGGSQGLFQYGFDTLGHCRIALTPRGNSPETIRLMDALKFGAIPLTVEDPSIPFRYVESFWKEPPAIISKTWTEAVDIVLHANSNPEALDFLQHRLMKWYDHWKECAAADWGQILTS